MSDEEKELRLIKQMIEELTSEAKSKSDLGINLINNLSGKFEDHLLQQAFHKKAHVSSGGLLSLIDRVMKIPQVLNYGPPYPDVFTRSLIEGLGNNGDITRGQTRLLNIYKMISLEPNGSCLITLPSGNDYFKAKVMVGILLILTPLLALTVWEVSACVLPGLPFSFLMGAVLGFLWRDVYNLAWGRERLAEYLTSKHPWFKCA